MIHLAITQNTRRVLAWGYFPNPPQEVGVEYLEVDDNLRADLSRPGEKTYNQNGTLTIIPPPPPPPAPPRPDYNNDDTTPEQIANAVTILRAYLRLAQPTEARTVTQVKLLTQAVLFLLRQFLP